MDIPIVNSRLVRLLFAVEFAVALIAVFTLWSQVAAQGHLDIIPWYWKLLLGPGTAFAAVKTTAAAMESGRPWTRRSVKWLAIMLALLAGCGMVTYYHHLYSEGEPDEEQPEEPSITASAYGAAGSSTLSLERVPLTCISRPELVSRNSMRPSSCVAPCPAYTSAPEVSRSPVKARRGSGTAHARL